jgi:PIN domain nuclease of toxin-antitoxin system
MILLDTQVIAWLIAVPEKLSPPARLAVKQARLDAGFAVADKTLWELAMMVSRRKIEIAMSMHGFLREVERVCTVLPIDATVAERSMQFSNTFPRDPADRIIAATAIVHGLQLVTSDSQIRASGEVPCIW